jgi:CSLREA domain-containing protein
MYCWMVCPGALATTINVNTLPDELNSNGNCSLREAVRAANTNVGADGCPAGSAAVVDTIVLQNGVSYGLSRVGEDETAITGDLDITDDVILIGNGATIDANGATTLDRVFQVLAGNNADFSNLTIREGRTNTIGGGIQNSGTLTLSTVTLTANSSPFNAGGGIASSGTLNLIDSSISNNNAATFGGGIVVLGGSLTAIQLTVSGNTTLNAHGGGISVTSNASIALTDSLVSGNHADTNGGGIFNENSATLLRTVVTGNSAGTPGGVSEAGGGIYNVDTLILTDSTISSNTADDSGGMINDGGTLTIVGSTIRGNTATSVAGLRNTNSGSARLTNSTVSSNSASASAGGIANGAAATLELSNVTIAFNTADSDANNSGDGGGLSNSASVTARNTLIGENIDASTGGNIFPDCSGALTSAGNNLVENVTGCSIGGNTAGNITGTAPNLAALANNGGPTQTNAFPSSAPPFNAGNAGGCRDAAANLIATDQRGTARAQPTRCDIGAYEFDNTPPTVLSSLRLDANPTSAAAIRFGVTFSEPVTGVAVSRFAALQVGVSGASVIAVSGSGASYVVQVATGSGNGSLRLAVGDPANIRDLGLNAMPSVFSTGEFYTIDRALGMFANGFE